MKSSKIVVVLCATLCVSTIAMDSANSSNSSAISNENIVRIVLMGKTGAGKSTTINAFYNFIKKIKWNDFPKWFPIQTDHQACNVEEFRGRSVESHTRGQLGAVTQEPSEYMAADLNIAVSLIDCPGAADPRGIEQDMKNTCNIAQFITQRGDFNAIGVVLDGTMNRATAEEKYFIEQVKTIIPKSAHDRIFIIVSHGTTKSANVESFVKSVGLPVENIFYFDNFALSKDGYLKVDTEDLQGDDSDGDVGDPSISSVGNERREVAKKIKGTWSKSRREFFRLFAKAQSLGRNTSDEMAKISQLKNSVTEKIVAAYKIVELVEECEKGLETARNEYRRACEAYDNSLTSKTDAEQALSLARTQLQAAQAPYLSTNHGHCTACMSRCGRVSMASSVCNTMVNNFSVKQQDLDIKTNDKSIKNSRLNKLAILSKNYMQEKTRMQQSIIDLYLELDKVSTSSLCFHVGAYYDTYIRQEHDLAIIDRLNREKRFYLELVQLYGQKTKKN